MVDDFETALNKVSKETVTGYGGIPDFYCGAHWARSYTLEELKPLLAAWNALNKSLAQLADKNVPVSEVHSNSQLANQLLEQEFEKLKAKVKK